MSRAVNTMNKGVLALAAVVIALVGAGGRARADAPIRKPIQIAHSRGLGVRWTTTKHKRLVLSIPRRQVRRLLAMAGVGGPGGAAGGDARGLGTVETVVVGLALSGAIALLGLWLARRRRRVGREGDGAVPAAARARAGGVLLVLLFAAGLGITLLSVRDARSDVRVRPRVPPFAVERSRGRKLTIDAPVRDVCPLIRRRPRPPG